jgi:acyl carrier protein
MYGQTETTGIISVYDIPPQSDDRLEVVHLGPPLSNSQIYVLDQHQQPVPIGVPGELHIGGASLARGYLNRPELTAKAFIPNPFNDEPEARLYKTGDLVRYLPDGTIEFVGRIDYQVKIRGFRIELGEIEAVLAQHPKVLQAVVIAREDEPGEKRLVAYVVPKQEQAVTSQELRGLLKEKLPDYMVPSTFVILDTLPLTLTGKIDRRALPAPDKTPRSIDVNFVAPRTPTEEVLTAIWTEVLGVQSGIYDNFFEAGGHSLLATQVISRIRDVFSVELSLHSLFETPTVAGLAVAITSLSFANAQSQAQKVDSEDVDLLLAELEGLSDEEVQKLLAEQI